MSIGNQTWTDVLSDTYTTEFHPLGTKRIEYPDYVSNGAGTSTRVGPREYVFAYNDEASNAFSEGACLEWDSSDYAPFNMVLSTGKLPGYHFGGVGIGSLAAGSYGWVGRRGAFLCTFAAGSGLANGDAVITAASGQFAQATLSGTSPDLDREIVGVAMEAASATSGTENLLVMLL